MKSPKRKQLWKAGIAMALVLLFVVVGCSDNPVVSKPKGEPRLLTRAIDLNSGISQSTTDYHVSKLISAQSGGVVSLLDVQLIVPPAALANDVTFDITIPDITVFFNEFGPSGLTFMKPVTVIMSYRNADLSGVDESTIRIGYYNPNTDTFEDMLCEVDHFNKVVKAQLHHFSAYALISDED